MKYRLCGEAKFTNMFRKLSARICNLQEHHRFLHQERGFGGHEDLFGSCRKPITNENGEEPGLRLEISQVTAAGEELD